MSTVYYINDNFYKRVCGKYFEVLILVLFLSYGQRMSKRPLPVVTGTVFTPN